MRPTRRREMDGVPPGVHAHLEPGLGWTTIPWRSSWTRPPRSSRNHESGAPNWRAPCPLLPLRGDGAGPRAGYGNVEKRYRRDHATTALLDRRDLRVLPLTDSFGITGSGPSSRSIAATTSPAQRADAKPR